MAKITPGRNYVKNETITVRTKSGSKNSNQMEEWWNAGSKKELSEKLNSTASFLKEINQYRYRQAIMFSQLYGNMPLMGGIGTNLSKFNTKAALPSNRPTMSVITSCVDTLVSRITQSKPTPQFLTDNADYRQRNLAKQLNNFIAGELYQTKAYEIGERILRDACVWGTGVIKVLEDQNKKVALERRLPMQIMVDFNEAFISDPRQFYELQLVDRAMLAESFPKYRSTIESAEQAYPDGSNDSSKTVSDLVMVVEAWRLPSGPEADDGVHVMSCTDGLIMEEKWTKTKAPYVFFNYSDPQVGWWGQGLAERQMGTQNAINQLLIQIHESISLVGVPRVFVEDGSKVVKAQLNNSVGSIVTYRGTKPSYEIAPCVPVELYSQLERLIQYAYQQEGISQLAADSKKPAGLNSGEAIRSYDDIQDTRFTTLIKRYEQMYTDIAYLIVDKAKDICERDGKYQTVYPNKDGTKQIDLPKADILQDPFVIKCLDMASLPKELSGRLQKITEMMQAGLISPDEGRRLLGFPDIDQVEKLNNACEERILQILDQIVEDGTYTPPDPFMDIQLAEKLVTQYYNLYVPAKLDEDKAQKLRDFFSQVQALKQQAMQAMQPQGPQPQAAPMPQPQNEMIPNVPGVQ